MVVFSLLWASVSSTLLSSIIISRHGVRTPYGPNGDDFNEEAFRAFSNLSFPVGKAEWGVDGIGILTPNGAEAVRRMGTWYGSDARYSAFVPSESNDVHCEDLVFFADNCQRDIETAREFAKGMAPQCSGVTQISTENAAILFNEGSLTSPQCRMSPREQSQALAGGANATALTEYYLPLINRVGSIINCCNASLCDGATPCRMANLPIRWLDLHWSALGGPLAVAGYFAEFFLLEYLNNMSFAFGQMSPRDVVDADRLQVNLYELVDTKHAARSFASTMIAYVIGSLQQTLTGASLPGMMHGPSAKLVYLAGHDTNLVMLRYMLDLDWVVEGWVQNTPPPGGMLVIELHEERQAQFVRIYFEVARPEQMRSLHDFTPADPPARTRVVIPDCVSDTSIDCPVNEFLRILAQSTNPECIQIDGLQKIVRDLLPKSPEPSTGAGWKWAFVGTAVGFGVLFLVLGGLYFRRRRRSSNLDELRTRQLLEEPRTRQLLTDA